jgi:hypothetical protein
LFDLEQTLGAGRRRLHNTRLFWQNWAYESENSTFDPALA